MTFLQLLDKLTDFSHEVLRVNYARRQQGRPPLQLPDRSFVITWWDEQGQCFLVDVTEQVKLLVADSEEQLPELKAARDRNLIPPDAKPGGALSAGLELSDVMASLQNLLRKPE